MAGHANATIDLMIMLIYLESLCPKRLIYPSQVVVLLELIPGLVQCAEDCCAHHALLGRGVLWNLEDSTC